MVGTVNRANGDVTPTITPSSGLFPYSGTRDTILGGLVTWFWTGDLLDWLDRSWLRTERSGIAIRSARRHETSERGRKKELSQCRKSLHSAKIRLFALRKREPQASSLRPGAFWIPEVTRVPSARSPAQRQSRNPLRIAARNDSCRKLTNRGPDRASFFGDATPLGRRTAPMYRAADRQRMDGNSGIGPHDAHRGAFRKDYARLIHAPSFRRLQNKTQLFPSVESDFFRNRLTHSIEVAQIAGGITQVLNARERALKQPNMALDVDLVQFAGAAHDLGHPPFGHNGESALDDAMKEFGGFEGNAQTLRILARLEKKVQPSEAANNADSFGRLGLNLCLRSLAAILKYDTEIPTVRSDKEELLKGYYSSEASLVQSIKQAVAPRLPLGEEFKTVECRIMDVADDISYSTYDLEDTLKAGFLTPLQIIREVESDDNLVSGIDEDVRKVLKKDGEDKPTAVTREEVVAFLRGIFFGETKSTSPPTLKGQLKRFSDDRDYVEDGYTRSAFTGWLVGRFIDAVEFEFNARFPALSRVRLRPDVRRVVEILKHLNYRLTIRAPRLAVVQYRGYDLVRKIFDALTKSDGRDLLPQDVRRLHDRCANIHEQRRVVCDFVAGMTDRYAVEFYGRLCSGDQTIFKPF